MVSWRWYPYTNGRVGVARQSVITCILSGVAPKDRKLRPTHILRDSKYANSLV